MKFGLFMSANPFKNLDEAEIRNSPEFFNRTYHWVKLLDFATVALKDTRDGAYILIFVVKDLPDLLVEFNPSGRVMTFYSNILTQLQGQPDDKVKEFLIKALKIQINFPSVRINVLDADTLPIRILSNYRSNIMNMEFFSELVTEAMDFLGVMDQLINEFGFPEIWRETEGEEKKMEEIRKYNVVNEYF